MHFDSGDQIVVIILGVATFLLANELTKVRRQLRDLQRQIDEIRRR